MKGKTARILGILAVAAFGVTLAAWPLSYFYACDTVLVRFLVDVRGGGYYFIDLGGRGVSRVKLRSFNGVYLEDTMGTWPQRWKPVRVLRDPTWFNIVVVAAWLPPLVLAYPAWLTVRRWRWGRREAGRGFDVAGVA